jgi:hypothetical protein
MHRPRHVLFSLVFFLAFLLHCAEPCLGTLQSQGAKIVSAVTQPGPEQSHCHSSPAAPRETPEACADCTGHVFLAPPPDTATLTASGSVLSPFCLGLPLLIFSRREHTGSVFAREGLAPPLRTLTSVVLRL